MLSNTKILGLLLVGLAICSCAMYLLSGVADESLGGFESASYAQYQIDMSGASSFTNASIDEINDGGLVLRRTDVLKSRNSLFRHRSARFVSSASVPSVSSISGGSAGARMTIHTTSSAEFHSFGGGGSAVGNIGGTLRTSTHNQSSAMSAAPIYATSGNTQFLAYRGEKQSSEFDSGATLMVQSAAIADNTQITQGNPFLSNSYEHLINNGSLKGGALYANAINRVAPTVGNYWDYYNAWLNSLVGDTESGWLYDGEGGMTYFDKAGLEAAWEQFEAFLESQGVMPGTVSWDTSWDAFWAWFSAYGEEGSYDSNHMNEWYRLPLPDGSWLLCVMALLYAVVIYIRQRIKLLSNKNNMNDITR